MASDSFQLCTKIVNRCFLLLIILLFFADNSVNSIPTRELDSMVAIVRARGYNLFPNAITTSDLGIDLLTASSNSSFTFFAPTDSSLFALAMTQSASSYTTALRYHGVPRRFSMSDLRRLPSRVTIPTLLPSQYIFVNRRRRGSRSDAISINGINIVLPGLYYGRHVAVHGLGGILSLHSQIALVYSFPPVPTARPSGPSDFPPKIGRGSNGFSPVAPKISPSTGAKTTNILPINHTFLIPAPEPAHSPMKSPANRKNSDLQSSIRSPLRSPGLPPETAFHLTPALYPLQNENAATPQPLISSGAPAETALRMESEDSLSGTGSTVERFEPLDWMTFDFSNGKPNHVDIEDSHPHVLKHLNF